MHPLWGSWRIMSVITDRTGLNCQTQEAHWIRRIGSASDGINLSWMNTRLLEWLKCPFCGGDLTVSRADRAAPELEYGILNCYCGHYPVVAGIPVLKRNTDELITFIETGECSKALLAITKRHLFGRPTTTALQSWTRQAQAMLANDGTPVTARDLLAHFFRNQKDNYDYFFYRFGQPRHLVALSFASIIRRPNKPILDLACGCGHITRSLLRQANGELVIGANKSFLEAYVAKRWVAPEAQYICCDNDESLPFPDGAFAVVLCSDAFHYFENKMICARELERLTRDDGFFMMVWVHNANVRLPHDGLPLPPEGYHQLVTKTPHRLVADRTVLSRYLQKEGPPLGHQADLADLAHEPLLSLVVSHRNEVFEDYGLFQNWPHGEGVLGFNPLYTEHQRDCSGRICLRRVFPSTFYEQDHAECKAYLPEMIDLSLDVQEDLASGVRTPEIERLIERYVLMDIPKRYR
jgi:SAM-dependent methyltransferase/uncharacterized protein YbaR (Trm112 family)